ncbi:TetR/AcrR family transcriptional regulator [Xiamenia xianingshaonis]|uniref:TetR family transcriptional regulator n=1 Tax=Xiamenia xianingshaonis TaxID=2682776 RepID=A0A9E6MQW9_9ACTN|nr:TetR family transcriptional regulator [Xiamenia xianingshaonis]NHM15047.1 TetR family transcriptional regulator [Xiamenia xianingshaonis]QTU84076.1 TetR/AcrR family transcriptional regulator [Xiamenia xianingshaonis]
MGETSQTPKSLKAQITRTSLVLAAAALLREEGPRAVTYRKVAKWAGAASSSVGYYFDSVTQLLHEAGRYNIQLWGERAERVATTAEALPPEECRERLAELLVSASLPDDSIAPAGHYSQLIAAAEAPAVTEAYQKGRVMLELAISRILRHGGVTTMPPRMVGTVVDGAAIAALSEGYDVRDFAVSLVQEALQAYERTEGGE